MTTAPLPVQPPIPCPACSGSLFLRPSRYGLFYGCSNFPACDMTHGAHQATGKPLGSPADRATREARIAAHDVFDRLWTADPETGAPAPLSRNQAYRVLRKVMELSEEDCHIGRFSREQCEACMERLDHWMRCNGVS